MLDLLAPRPPAEVPPVRPGRSRAKAPERPRRSKNPPGYRSEEPATTAGGSPNRRLTILATAAAMTLVLIGVWIGVGKLTSAEGETQNRANKNSNTPAPQVVPSSASSTDPTPAPTASNSVSAAWARQVKLGVFRGTEPAQIASFGSWLGRKVDYVVDFSPRQTWNDIANPTSMINQWAGRRYRVVYSTGMIPNTGNSTMADGARGDYDEYFTTLAQHLVSAGEDDAIIRLGWEFNLESSKWATSKPAAFISYWRHVVTAMRSVPGQHFQFDWNPNVGETKYDATLYYPGSAYVDYIGVDVYDVSWDPNTYPYPASCDDACRLPRQKAVWQRLYNGAHGLGFWAQFAQGKHKPMSLPEWGCWLRNDHHGGGDDPYFVEQMYRFIATPANNVAYQAYFETTTDEGTHRLMTTLTNAAKTYQERFGT